MIPIHLFSYTVIGALNDYKDLPGIAHFLEHMLFMGSKKYPEENDYDEFLSEHAGDSNAFTDEETTNFHFEVGADFLAPALDRYYPSSRRHRPKIPV